eukprot:TRINITY_DN377_c0_g4_i1.p1 TRINITY_DN377_c0_g4~~TRINITY_DN377_c0_g4_i1.p1  ORF type:complete len:1246 (-),score=241.07 TRINITY_DN377_c0_g4_i1:127-3864(-)
MTATISNTPSASITPSATRTVSPSSSSSPTQSRTPSPTSSETPTSSRTASPSRSVTPSSSASRSVSITPTSSKSFSASVSPSRSPSASPSPTRSTSATISFSGTPSRSATPTGSISRSTSPTGTISRSASPSGTISRTASNSPTISRSASQSPSNSRTPSGSPSNSRTPSGSPTNSRSPSATGTISGSISVSATVSGSISVSGTVSRSASRSATTSRTPSASPSSSRSASSSPSASPSATASISLTRTASASPSSSRTASASISLTRTASGSPSAPPSATASISLTRTASPSATVTRTASSSPTQSRSVTVTPSPSVTQTRPPSPSRSVTPSASVTRSSSPSVSLSKTASKSASHSATPTISKTPSVSPSIVPNCPDLGFVPTNNLTDFQLNYPIWRSTYVTSSGAPVGLRVVDYTDCAYPSRTISEGIAYGMILSAFAQDAATFDGLWQYAQYYFNKWGCMSYLIDVNGHPLDYNCAPDADEDMAYALMVASITLNNTNYYNNGVQMANAIFSHSVDPTSKTLLPFPPWYPNPTSLLNPSYFAPGYYDMWMGRDTLGNRWDLVQSSSYTMLSKNGPTVVRDWCNSTGGIADPNLAKTPYCTIYPSTTFCDQWYWRIRPDPLNSPSTKMSFFFENIPGLTNAPTNVQVDCGSGYRAGTFDATPMWTLTGSAASCTGSTVTLKVTDGLKTAEFFYINWIGSYCSGVQDGFNSYYGFDAIRMPWRTVFDAAYLSNTQSKTRCTSLIAGPFASVATIDGQKFVPSGNAVTATFTGELFRAPAVVCATLRPGNDATRLSLLANLAGPLKDHTYYADTIQLLMQLFVSGGMTNATCALIKNTAAPLSVTGLPAGPGVNITAPTPICYRYATNLNYQNFTGVAVEFSDKIIYHKVEIDCEGGTFRLASQPNPNPFNTFYINTVCTNPNIQVRLTKSDLFTNFVGPDPIVFSVTKACNATTAPRFCWESTSQMYYLQVRMFSPTVGVQINCGDYSTSLASRGERSLPALQLNYPVKYDTGFTPGVICSASGQTLLVSNDGSAKYGYLTNWKPGKANPNDLCPVGTVPPAPTGTKPLFCWRPTQTKFFQELKVNRDIITSVSSDCGGGVSTVVWSDSAKEYQITTSAGCTDDGEVTLTFNGQFVVHTNRLYNNTCPDVCFQNTSQTYYVGVGFEHPQPNVTISQPSSVCRYPGPLYMEPTSAFSYGTPNDLQGLDFCFDYSPANTTITYWDANQQFRKTFVGDYRDPKLQCLP